MENTKTCILIQYNWFEALIEVKIVVLVVLSINIVGIH